MPELKSTTSCGGATARTAADALPCATDACRECPLAMLRRLGALKIKAKAPAENDGMILLPLSDPANLAS
ncbi:MAG: hypothetical protein AAGJ10_04660 [Bacteroidota bacterium]